MQEGTSPQPDSTTAPDATLVLHVGYRGGDFSGFAEQQSQRTVAGELKHALETVLRRPVELTCAGRTDAGVHALAQYVSVPVFGDELELSGRRLERSLSAILPSDVSVRGLYRATPGFSARFDALSRSYRYRIACGNARPVMGWGHVWWLWSAADLDVEAMHEAAQLLLGEHDFRSFCKTSSADMLAADGRSTSRELRSIAVRRIEEAGEPLIAIDIEGNAFLHNMVRIITGSLVEVGRHNRSPQWLGEALEACNRTAAGPTAPPEGLTFERVRYPEGALEPWG